MTRRNEVRVLLPDGPTDVVVGPDPTDGAPPVGREGRVYDDAYIAEVVEETQRELRGRGRPSLSGGRTHSPVLRARVPDALYEQYVERAQREGKTLSDLTREALNAYVA
jgi:hypothetical protein